ncbi:MAG: hypothetical protein DMF84_09415 [Acidobacteria bacterium]|nr:MAG: hypothetical protein DMF84_09415 [Acidobacteriota bacterium]
MKVLIVGNYVNNRQESMQRLAELLREGLEEEGHEVQLVRPPVLLGRLRPDEIGLGKWLGYVDRFLVYPALLRVQVQWADVVHVCDQANSVYLPHLRGKPHVITCNDVLAIRAALGEIPESPTRWTGRVYQSWILRNLRRAQFVACISSQTQKEVQRLIGLGSDVPTVVPLALNYPYKPMMLPAALPYLRARGIDHARPFLIHVGGNQWYKNRPGVVRIFAELVKRPHFKSHRLLLVGKPWTGELRQLVHILGVHGGVLEMVDVGNEELHALYSTAEALLFPSLEEGLGWPILEAQACGCPVITTNRPPMTDVSGGAAILVDPSVPEEAAQAIANMWPARASMKQAGLANAALYTRQRMIADYLRTYTTVCAQQLRGCES